MLKTAWDWITLASIKPDMAVAQLQELRRQVPLLYALLCVNAIALAYTHSAVAPSWMTLWIPGVLVVFCAVRAVFWLRGGSHTETPEAARRMLRRTAVLSLLLSIGFVTWSLEMNGFGGERQHTHVAIFIAVTAIGCTFCLMHLPQAALISTTVVTLPYFFFYLSMGDPAYTSISINILLVTLVVIRVLLNNFGGFSKLIHAQQAAEALNEEISVLANTDVLTGLPNRRSFFAELERREENCARENLSLSMGVLDLDHFKAANDTFGHTLGDRLLASVAQRLQDALPAGAMAARFGGDEFAFVVDLDGDEALEIARQVCASLSLPYELDGAKIAIAASCGVTSLDMRSCVSRSLYDCADYALYNAKAERRGSAVLYSQEHDARMRSERELESLLHGGDLEAELDVHFQPIVRIRDRSIVAVEALARWTSPTLGTVSPACFIPIAERAGLIHRLTGILFGKTLNYAEKLPDSISVSFNLSAHDLVSHETILGIVSAVRRSSVDPKRLIFELTETAILRDMDAATQSLRALRALGASIALDDFGTGHSSLNYLGELPIDKVKLDRSFVARIGDPAGERILSAIVALCHSLGMDCIAEGVETCGQEGYLRKIKPDQAQGYFYARPKDMAETGRMFPDDEGFESLRSGLS